MTCVLGHTRKAMECPSCSGVSASSDPDWWAWYRARTMSVRVKDLIDEQMAASMREERSLTDTNTGRVRATFKLGSGAANSHSRPALDSQESDQ